jgi:hypothetical protein
MSETSGAARAVDQPPATSRFEAWQCIGCGKIEAPQPCIGVCQDRKVEFVYAAAYDGLLAEVERERRRAQTLEAVVRQLALTAPREGGWERSYRALQAQARRTLGELSGARR